MATVPRSAEAERHDPLLQELLGRIAAYNPNLDADAIRTAFDYACDPHVGQVRKSGEPCVVHPCAVAEICAELKLDSATITAALLHDTVEDTEAELDDVRTRFGEDVALLVDGVTKLTRISFASREQAQVENYRKMIVAMAHDLRVVLIKLADRLHNMRTISALGKQKQVQTARETLEIYAPLAHRLGIHSIKWELEDLAFACCFRLGIAPIVRMLCNRSASLISRTLTSLAIATSILRIVAACWASFESNSSRSSLVTPSTIAPTSAPKSATRFSSVSDVSSTASCRSAPASVTSSRPRSARIMATPSGCAM